MCVRDIPKARRIAGMLSNLAPLAQAFALVAPAAAAAAAVPSIVVQHQVSHATHRSQKNVIPSASCRNSTSDLSFQVRMNLANAKPGLATPQQPTQHGLKCGTGDCERALFHCCFCYVQIEVFSAAPVHLCVSSSCCAFVCL